MISVERLVARLRGEGWCIPDPYEFCRTRAGHWQLSAGAWKWQISALGVQIGSCGTVGECLRAKTLVSGRYGGIEIED